MTVRVLLFSALRERIGSPSMVVDVESAASAREVIDELADRYPVLNAYRPFMRVAVNRQYSELDVQLTEGDELALITPVSGG